MTDGGASRRPLEEVVAQAVSAGVDWVQLRERALSGAAWLELADRIAAAARRAAEEGGREVRIIVNRRADVALAVGADGVHLGFDAMDAGDARRLLGDAALVGISAHHPDEIAKRSAGASYAQLAPIYPPLSKPPSRAPVGLAGLAPALASGLPVLAQGGIDARHAAAARDAGAAGVAVTGAILLAEDPGAAAAALREALDG